MGILTLIAGVSIILGASPEALPEVVLPPGVADVVVVAEGHPARLTITAIDPGGNAVPVAACVGVSTCAGILNFDECSGWTVTGLVEYLHPDPGGGGPYVWAVSAAAVVVGCEVFADGFETGTTAAWSATQGE
jgi:hypothetical protein